MKDDFETTFVVELAPREVWEAIARCAAEAGAQAEGERYVLPGWPSFPPQERPGASCTLIEREPQRLLRVRKDHFPCAGTEIAIRLEQAATGTRVTIVQSGFGDFLELAGRDTVFAHGVQIAHDFRLYLERGLTVPGTVWGPDLGARTRQVGVGVEIRDVAPGAFADQVGLRAGDLLLTLAGIRIHDLPQLGTVLALHAPGSSVEVTWARGREPMAGSGSL